MSTAPDQVIPGLEGVFACESSIAYIDGSIPELTIRGYAIKHIVSKLGFEEMVFLLWHDRVPTASELGSFRAELAELRGLPAPVLDLLKTAPKSAANMASMSPTSNPMRFKCAQMV